MAAEGGIVTAIVAVADVDTAAPVVAAGTHALQDPVLDILVVCSHSAQMAAFATVVAIAPDSAHDAVLVAVGAFARIVPAALLAAACTIGVREEGGHVVAEAAVRAVQAAQSELELGPAVAVVVGFGYARGWIDGAAVAGSEEHVGTAAVHIVAVFVDETRHPGHIEAAAQEAAVGLIVYPDSLVHRS